MSTQSITKQPADRTAVKIDLTEFCALRGDVVTLSGIPMPVITPSEAGGIVTSQISHNPGTNIIYVVIREGINGHTYKWKYLVYTVGGRRKMVTIRVKVKEI